MPERQIAVIGLGATGSAAVRELTRRGVRVIGIEQFEIEHDRGSSHGPTRIIRLTYYENTAYVPLMRRAYELWRELERIAKQRFLNLTGIVETGAAGAEIIRGPLAAVEAHGLQSEILNAHADYLEEALAQFGISCGE